MKDDESELDESEYPDEADLDDSDSVDTEPCPYCGKPIFAQAEVCPDCGSYISREDAPARGKPVWILIGAILMLLVVVFVWLR